MPHGYGKSGKKSQKSGTQELKIALKTGVDTHHGLILGLKTALVLMIKEARDGFHTAG